MFRWFLVLNGLLVTCGGVFLHSHKQEFEDVYVRHVAGRPKRSTYNNNGGHFKFPEKMLFSLGINKKRVHLSLTLNKKQTRHVRMQTLTSRGFSPVERGSKRDFAYYQFVSKRKHAAIKVRCPEFTFPCHMEGNVQHSGRDYAIEHNPAKARVRSNDVPHKLYLLEKSIRGAYDQDTITEAVEDHINRGFTWAKMKGLIRRLKRNTQTNHIIELEMVLDAAIWRFWKSFVLGTDADVLDAMGQYYEGVANNMDLRYKFLGSTKHTIDLVPLEITISQEDASTPWVENSLREGEFVDKRAALSGFREWVLNNLDGLSDFDAVMGFTGKNLASFDKVTGELETNGAFALGNAYLFTKDNEVISALCGKTSLIAVSVVEDLTFGDLGRTTTHELAHNQGVYHDTYDGCDDMDQFIMAGTRSIFISDSSKASNPWLFSTCSRAKIELTMDKLLAAGKTCLQRHTFNQETYSDILRAPLIGETLSLDEQCERRAGIGSTRCLRNPDNPPPEENICFQGIYCTLVGVCQYIIDVEIGSPCGEGKYCYRGECINKPTGTTSTTLTTTPATTTTTTPVSTTTTTTTTAAPPTTKCKRKGRKANC